MSRNHAHTALFVAVLVASLGQPALAQGTDSLRQRIEALTAEWRELHMLANQLDSLQSIADGIDSPNKRVDSVAVGFLVVTTDPQHAGIVRPAVTHAWSEARRRYGAAASLLGGTTFHVELTASRLNGRVSFARATATRVRVSTENVPGIATGLVLNATRVGERMRWVLATAIENHLRSLVPREMTDWAGVIGPTVPQYEMRRAYLDLIGNPTTAARACWNRRYEACRIALGLHPASDPLTDWYTESDRRALVMSQMDRYRLTDPARRQKLNACMDGTTPGDCLILLREQDYRDSPLDRLHRIDVTLTAMRAAGEDGFVRLVNSHGTVIERLEMVAGMPIDSILVRWRDEIDAAAGAPVRVTVRTGLTTTLWILVFMFAAARSSRWRSH